MAKIKNADSTESQQGWRATLFQIDAGRNTKGYSHSEKVSQFLVKVNIHLFITQQSHFWVFTLEKWKLNILPTNVYCSSILICQKNRSNLHIPQLRMDKPLYISTMKYHSAIKKNALLIHKTTNRNLKGIKVNPRNPSQKVIHHTTPFIWQSQKDKTRDEEHVSGCQGLGASRGQL